MGRRNLGNEVKFIRHVDYTVAGQTAIQPSNGVDMQGFDAGCFLFIFGTIEATSVVTITLEQSSEVDGAVDTFAAWSDDCRYTVAADKDNKLFWVDFNNHTERYVRAVVTRETADATVDAVIALLYRPNRMPLTQGDTSVGGGGSTAK